MKTNVDQELGKLRQRATVSHWNNMEASILLGIVNIRENTLSVSFYVACASHQHQHCQLVFRAHK